MNDFTTDLNDVKFCVKQILNFQKEIDELSKLSLSAGQAASARKKAEENLHDAECVLEAKIKSIVCFPPHHLKHIHQLNNDFWTPACYEQSVFIMTKFPEGNTKSDTELKKIIGAVSKGVTEAGCKPRIASDKEYHSGLWENVELHLLGCMRGIAIVEDRYKQELNPNVAIEWGWMRGMGRRVLYLVENTFSHARADWGGLITHPFDWKASQDEIAKVVSEWLQE